MNFIWLRQVSLALFALLLSAACLAQEATIRKNITERYPEIKAIDEISKSDVPGLFELRINGSEIYYTDAQGNYLIVGNIYDTKQRRNLTEERVNKLTAIKFENLPLKDAFAVVRGNGERKLAVFQDPNCGFCKRFERDLQNVNNVTVYMFLYPILGQESVDNSKAVWCAKDRVKVWQDWMVNNKAIPKPAQACDTTALNRNVEMGRNLKITGTPTLIFEDGTRVPGAIDAKQLEKRLAEIKS